MSLIAVSKIRKPRDTPYKLVRRILGLDKSERITILRIISAYTDLDWIEKVVNEFRGRTFECVLDYGASGYNRDQKTTERLKELAAIISNTFENGSGIYLARMGKFLHSKLLIARTSQDRYLGAVGSLNFTRRGFLDNEEIVYIVKNPKSIMKYSNGILKATKKIPLDEEFIQSNTTTYRDWMLAGSIFFEDKESSPFNFKLGLPDGVLSSVSDIHSMLEARTSDNVSILKILEIEANGRAPGWKKYCISTCYGYWCPDQLKDEAIGAIQVGVKKKQEKLSKILKSNGASDLKKLYIRLFDEVEESIRKLGDNWNRAGAVERLDAWINRVVEKLNDEDNQRRLLAGVGGPAVVPDLWAGDELALHEFEQSFCSHLVIELAKKRVSNKLAQFLWDSDFTKRPVQFEPFGSNEWEEVWYDGDKWLEWLHQQSMDPFERVAGEA